MIPPLFQLILPLNFDTINIKQRGGSVVKVVDFNSGSEGLEKYINQNKIRKEQIIQICLHGTLIMLVYEVPEESPAK